MDTSLSLPPRCYLYNYITLKPFNVKDSFDKTYLKCEFFSIDTHNLKAKSLKTYQEKFSPEVSVRTSMADFKKESWLVNLPLYGIEQIAKLAEDGMSE